MILAGKPPPKCPKGLSSGIVLANQPCRATLGGWHLVSIISMGTATKVTDPEVSLGRRAQTGEGLLIDHHRQHPSPAGPGFVVAEW